MDQPEQDVLGADEVVVEEPRLFLGQDEDSSGSVGEALEQKRNRLPMEGFQSPF
jgi:hypothetical protein